MTDRNRHRSVLAMNAWAASVGELRRKLFVISSDVIATQPINDARPPR